MSIWEEHDVEGCVRTVLEDVRLVNDAHHFGRPYISAYQLAIRLNQQFPAVRVALDQPLGGAGVGERNSLAQYLARELSRRIHAAGDAYPIEGAFISNQDVLRLTYTDTEGQEVTSSVTNSGFDLSMFRLRAGSAGPD